MRLVKGQSVLRHSVATALVVPLLMVLPTRGDSIDEPADGRAEGTTQNVARLKALSLEQLMAVQVDTVTTASRKTEKVADAPATVIVIERNQILLRGYSTLKDVLRDLPGMETVEYYFSEIGTLVPVRGIVGNNKIVVLVNGMRVNPPGGEYVPFRSDFSVRDAERIEVIYGPGSTLYGQDAISAVINVITRKTAGGEAGADAGLNQEREAWGAFGGVLDRDGRVRLSGCVQYHDSDLTDLDKKYPEWWNTYRELAEPRGSGTVPDRQDFGVNVFARLEVDDTSLQVWHRDSRRSSSEGGYPPAYVEEAIWEDRQTVSEAKNVFEVSASTKLDSAVTYSRYAIDPQSRYVFQVPGLTNAWYLNDFKYGIGEGYTAEETLHGDFNDQVSWLAGVMAGTFDVIPKSTIPGGADPDGDLVKQGGGWMYTVGDDPTLHRVNRVVESQYQTYAAYAELGWRLTDRLRAVGGTRVTKDTRFDDIPFTPRAALIYDLTEHLTAKYIYTRAYVAPAPYFANATYDNGVLLATANPDLRPETADTHEINLTFNRKNLMVSASGYYGCQHDIITLSDRAAEQNIVTTEAYLDGDHGQRRTLVMTANGGDSESYGADLFTQGTWGDMNLWASYSYVDFNGSNPGTAAGLPGISKHNGRLGVTWEPVTKLFVTPSLVIRSKPENVADGALANELQTPYEINLYVLYKATRRVDTFVTVRNLTDHRYALGGLSGAAVPQETFSAVAGMRVTF